MLRLHTLVGPPSIQSQTLHLLLKQPHPVRLRHKLITPPAGLSTATNRHTPPKPTPKRQIGTTSLSAMEISAQRPTITHIIFDMDGLLIDTENFYSQVQEVILARFGKTFDWSLKAKMMGKKALESAKIFVEETGISGSLSPEQFLVEREDMLLTLFPTCKLMPGVSRLINHLHTKGIPMSVATGSHKRHFELKTQNHGNIFSMMHHIVMGDDPEVKKGKPSPDIFLAASRRFEGGAVDPSKILVFEDAPAGVGAAKNAGMSVVMVPDARLDSSYHSGADQDVGDVALEDTMLASLKDDSCHMKESFYASATQMSLSKTPIKDVEVQAIDLAKLGGDKIASKKRGRPKKLENDISTQISQSVNNFKIRKNRRT